MFGSASPVGAVVPETQTGDSSKQVPGVSTSLFSAWRSGAWKQQKAQTNGGTEGTERNGKEQKGTLKNHKPNKPPHRCQTLGKKKGTTKAKSSDSVVLSSLEVGLRLNPLAAWIIVAALACRENYWRNCPKDWNLWAALSRNSSLFPGSTPTLKKVVVMLRSVEQLWAMLQYDQ